MAPKKTKVRDENVSSAATQFSAIDKKLWLPGSGCSGALDYMEQSSWLLFLRYLDAYENERMIEAAMLGNVYEPTLPKKLRWSTWAYPLNDEGKLDADKILKGDELIFFVQHSLFPGLRALKDSAEGTDSIKYRVGSIFEQLNCRFTDGYLLREVIDLMHPLKFQTEEDRHELTVLYEERLGEMGNAGRDGGQYYTPRSLIRTMIRLLDPKIGEKFDDGACGSGGFLCEAYQYMRTKAKDDPKAYQTLQKKSFSGGEVKPLAFVTAQMNCILHGLETPNITFGDTLANKIADFTDKDRVDVIGANPPFGAGANKINQQNFTVMTSETALMFMEYFMAKLKKKGRAAIIIKNTFLSNTDNASIAIRRMLLTKCRLNWVLDLPAKVFTAGVQTVVLFFTKDGPTVDPINYYQLDMKGVSLGKTRPLNENDLAEFVAVFKGEKKGEGLEAVWSIDPKTIDQETFDLSVKNPNKKPEKRASAAECRAVIKAAYAEIWEILKGWGAGVSSQELGLAAKNAKSAKPWPMVRLGDVCEINLGKTPPRGNRNCWDKDKLSGFVWVSIADMATLVDGKILDSKEYITKYAIEEFGVPVVEKGTLLLSFKLTLGRVAIAGQNLYTNEAIAALPIKKEYVSRVYLPYLILYFSFFDWSGFAERDEKVLGKTLNKKKLAEVPLLIPPIDVQKDIVDRLKKELGEADKVAAEFKRITETLSKLRKAILSEAFE